jgi:hypothetical protein
LVWLQNEANTGALDCGADSISFVSNNGEHIARLDQLNGRADHVLEERTATDLM